MHKCEFYRGRTPAESLQSDEAQAWRLWNATARRAVAAARQKRTDAEKIYWRVAFEIAVLRMECCNEIFKPVHVLESLSGLVNGFIAEGNWMAARSLVDEVADFFRRKSIELDSMAEKMMRLIVARVAAFQRGHEASVINNVEELSVAAVSRTEKVTRTEKSQSRYIRARS